MGTRIPVYVYSTDAITMVGLTAQLRQDVSLAMVDRHQLDRDTVVVVAAETLDERIVEDLRTLNLSASGRSVLVTGNLDDIALVNAIDLGVCALVRREQATRATLAGAIGKVAKGEAALPSDVLARLLKQVSRLQHNVLAPRGLTITGLTPREAKVLRLVADGLDTDEIAVQLCFSPRTVKNILQGVTTRFCLRNRTHAVAYALREGLI